MGRNKLYYPSNQITNNLYSYGEYMTEDGSQYIGHYHKYSDGSVMTGAYYDKNTSVTLLPFKNIENGSIDNNVRLYDKLTDYKYQNASINNNGNTTIIPIPFYPIFAQSCYDNGVAYRYFIRNVNMNNDIYNSLSLFEISSDYYNMYNAGRIDNVLYRVISIPWKLTGPMYDEQKDFFNKTAGVYDTNMRTVATYSSQFNGLNNYLTNFLELSIWDSAIDLTIRKLYNGYTDDEFHI